MPSISLCMIVKDEEQYLPACIASVKELVDEIIIVDTGSTDRTKEVAQQAGAKVFDLPWQDDFAAARNFSLSKATKDWILVLDADEAIAAQDHPRFRELLIWTIKQNPKIVGFKFHQRNYTNDSHAAEFVPCDPEERYAEQQGFAGYTLATPMRLFRRLPQVQYEGKVHEGVEQSILKLKGMIHDSGIPIHHFKERKGAEIAEQKRKAYGDMAAAQAAATPADAKPFYELGLTQKAEGKLDEALLSFKTALALDPQYRSPYSNIAEIYVKQGKIDEAMAMLRKAIATKAVPADHYNLGVLLMKQKQYQEAEAALKDAIRAAPNRVEFYTTLSSLYALQQQFGKALKVFDICIKQNPARIEPYNLLGVLLFKLGKRPEALKVLAQGKSVAAQHQQQSHPDYLKLLINLAESYAELGEKEKARAVFRELIERQPGQSEGIRKRMEQLS